jgi:myo-inositol catabolism protein IolS
MACLGRTTQMLARLAFGCEQLGGYEWGELDVREIATAIEVAIEQGVNVFDTADCYGRGESERRLGSIIKPHRDRVFLATKFGVRFSDAGSVWYDSSPKWAQQALEDSLRRLDTDVVDLLQMHYWDGVTPLLGLFDHLEKLRHQGKIRWYGITNHLPPESVPQAYPGFVSVSLEYSLIESTHERAAERLGRAGVTFLAYGSLGQGLLSGKYRGETRFRSNDRRARERYVNFHGERYARNQRIVEVLVREATKLGVLPSQAAIAWVLQKLPSSLALVGFKRVQQLREALGALTLILPPATMATLARAITESEVPAAGAALK